MSDTIVVRGAREHNLRNVDLDIRATALIVFTGLSGSGKSSLAFDTIYAEGQRRYVESLSAYARQFLGQMDKPDVDYIEGLSPAISIDQKSAVAQPAVDGRHHHRDLRLPAVALRAHRRPALPRTAASAITRQTPQQIVDRVLSCPTAPASRCWRRSCAVARASTASSSRSWPAGLHAGPGRRRGRRASTRSSCSTVRASTTIEVVVDRLVRRAGIERRLTDSLETALRLADGSPRSRSSRDEGEPSPRARCSPSSSRARMRAVVRGARAAQLLVQLSLRRVPDAATAWAPSSRSTPSSSSPTTTLSIAKGAIAPWSAVRGEYFDRMLAAVGDELRVPTSTAVEEARKAAAEDRALRPGRRAGRRPLQEPLRAAALVRDALRGRRPVGRAPPHRVRSRSGAREDRGVHARACRVPRAAARGCEPESSRSPSAARKSPRSASCRSRDALGSSTARADRARPAIAERVFKEIVERLRFLLDVGLDYLTLDRARGHAGRRRGAAHPARDADRQRADGRAVHPRRAVDRSAPARQPPPDRDAGAAARPRQHRDRRRARRGDDPGGRPRRRHRPRRGRARRRGDRRRARSRTC